MSRQDAAAVSDSLMATYAAVGSSIASGQVQAVTSRSRRALRSFKNDVDIQTQALDSQTYSWVTNNYSQIYAYGAVKAYETLPGQFSWSNEDEAAVTGLAGELYGRLVKATENVRTSARQLTTAARTVDRSTTPEELADMLDKRGVAAIRYSNGARYGLEDYVRMLLRTATSIAFNTGTVAASKAAGVEWVEVSDGADCGWESHDDGDKANGKIVPADDAEVHLIAHPNCQRLFVSRADIQTSEQAAAAGADNPDESPSAASLEPTRGEDRIAARLNGRAVRLDARQAS